MATTSHSQSGKTAPASGKGETITPTHEDRKGTQEGELEKAVQGKQVKDTEHSDPKHSSGGKK